MVKIELAIHFVVDIDTSIFLEIGKEILRLAFSDYLAKAVDVIGVFMVGYRHDGSEVVKTVFSGIFIGAFHPLSITIHTPLATLFHWPVFLEPLLVIVIIWGDDKFYVSIQMIKIPFEFTEPFCILIIGVDVRVFIVDHDLEVLV